MRKNFRKLIIPGFLTIAVCGSLAALATANPQQQIGNQPLNAPALPGMGVPNDGVVIDGDISSAPIVVQSPVYSLPGVPVNGSHSFLTGNAAAVHPPTRGDRANFVGSKACLGCHRSEYLGWLRTKHFENVDGRFDMEDEDSIAAKYFEKHGNLNACKDCHVDNDAFGRERIETGVSCETCHGAAGGPSGWLNTHASFGNNCTNRAQESFEHKLNRQALCDNAGMLRSGTQYASARKCNSCHIVSNKDVLVAGHKTFPDDFDFMSWLSGEVRHNFHAKPMHNADIPTLAMESGAKGSGRKRVSMVLGKLAEIEVCMLNLAAHGPDKATIAERIRMEEAAAELEDEESEEDEEEEEEEGEFPSAIDFWAERAQESAVYIREEIVNQDYLDEQAELARERAEAIADGEEPEEESDDEEEPPEKIFTDPDLLAVLDLVASVMGSPDAEETEEDADEEFDDDEEEEEPEEFDVWADGTFMREMGDYYHVIASRQQLRDVAARIAQHARNFASRHDGSMIKTISDDDLDVEGKGKKAFEPDRILRENQ